MLILRFTASSGAAPGKPTAEASPTTRSTLDSAMPPEIISRRAEFARSADSSQLLKPRSPLPKVAASVWPARLTRFGTSFRMIPISRSRSRVC